MDDDGSRSLDMNEFIKGVHDYGIVMETDEIKDVFAEIDTDHTGTLDFDEFLGALRVSNLCSIEGSSYTGQL